MLLCDARGAEETRVDAFLLETHEQYRRFYAGWKLRRQLRWAQPCIDQMAELMEDLRVR